MDSEEDVDNNSNNNNNENEGVYDEKPVIKINNKTKR